MIFSFKSLNHTLIVHVHVYLMTLRKTSNIRILVSIIIFKLVTCVMGLGHEVLACCIDV